MSINSYQLHSLYHQCNNYEMVEDRQASLSETDLVEVLVEGLREFIV